MSKDAPSVPPPPDLAALTAAQAQANRVTQFTPQGNLVYGNVDASGNFVPQAGAAAELQETPFREQYRQGFEDLATIGQQVAAPRIQNLPLSGIDTSGLPDRIGQLDFSRVDRVPSVNDFAGDISAAEKASFERAKGMLDPVFAENQRALESKLINQGLPVGSEAYEGDLKRFETGRNDAYLKAAQDAVAAGRAEHSRLYGLGASSREAQIADQLRDAQLRGTTRAAGVGEQQALRSSELGELASILGLQPVAPVGVQNFYGPNPVDVMGPANLAYQGQLAQYNAANQRNQGMNQGLFALGSAGIGLASGLPFFS